MISVTVRDQGAQAVLRGVKDKLAGPQTKRIMGRVGLRLVREYIQNFRKGIDADGKPLATIQRWTRYAGQGAGLSRDPGHKTVPLRNTGSLMNSINLLRYDATTSVVGFHGDARLRAAAQQAGTKGVMRLRDKGKRGWYSGILRVREKGKAGKRGVPRGKSKPDKNGKPYIRVKRNDGTWYTKQVKKISGGFGTEITPQRRPFFWIGTKQQRQIVRFTSAEIEKLLKAG